jgi:hypothetical protein
MPLPQTLSLAVDRPACQIISSRFLGHGCVERVEEQCGADQISGTVSTGQDEFVAPP